MFLTLKADQSHPCKSQRKTEVGNVPSLQRDQAGAVEHHRSHQWYWRTPLGHAQSSQKAFPCSQWHGGHCWSHCLSGEITVPWQQQWWDIAQTLSWCCNPGSALRGQHHGSELDILFSELITQRRNDDKNEPPQLFQPFGNCTGTENTSANLTGDMWSDVAVSSSFCSTLHIFINPYAVWCDSSSCCHGWVEPSLNTLNLVHSKSPTVIQHDVPWYAKSKIMLI